MNIDMNMISIAFFIIGFILMAVEIFYPSIGAFGISGGILLVLAIIFKANTLTEGVIMLVAVLAVLGIMLAIAIKSAKKGRLNNLVLNQELKKEQGYSATEELENYLDSIGEAITILRPSGMADFNGKKLDVVSEGDFVLKGEKVQIIKIEGRRVVVKKI